ncbi:MAG: hypothetical protein V2I43_12685 [Parvularcula sp.]|jgi:hypothetical protein|nr:hypothetical protein [Parvularcula sp.]
MHIQIEIPDELFAKVQAIVTPFGEDPTDALRAVLRATIVPGTASVSMVEEILIEGMGEIGEAKSPQDAVEVAAELLRYKLVESVPEPESSALMVLNAKGDALSRFEAAAKVLSDA